MPILVENLLESVLCLSICPSESIVGIVIWSAYNSLHEEKEKTERP